MRLLIDPRALIWWRDQDGTRSRKVFSALADRKNAPFVSSASAWKIAHSGARCSGHAR